MIFQYIRDNWETLAPQVATQLQIPLLSVAIASLLAVPMGILGARHARADAVFTALNSALLTLPSYALFGLLAFVTGTGNVPVAVGLILYALLPIQRNTTAGIHAVPPEVVDAARGMGLSRRQVLSAVQLPLALPIILAGVRQATAGLVAIATVGAAYNSNNLGRPILEFLRGGSLTKLYAVILLLVVVGLSVDAILAGVQRLLSRGRVGVVRA